MNTAVNIADTQSVKSMEPVLRRVLQDAEQEHKELQQIFTLMGWGGLPDALKMEIKDDVTAMVRELKGHYSSCDPHVARRRERVVYWVECFKDDVCSLETAIEALKVRSL
ncbi:hypothetical protein [Fodinibius salsisoli]|uniref:Uncharacterized protein n=1 Tax=Fodinibius salsisoli TaxID=2820877 RepID=A0ABT3PL43_9BACT|nr:hypothetical protein [Fodinibius salsisoli]MCW9706670.1 hypothetical protein [Fodinibius salsisoli]